MVALPNNYKIIQRVFPHPFGRGQLYFFQAISFCIRNGFNSNLGLIDPKVQKAQHWQLHAHEAYFFEKEQNHEEQNPLIALA